MRQYVLVFLKDIISFKAKAMSSEGLQMNGFCSMVDAPNIVYTS